MAPIDFSGLLYAGISLGIVIAIFIVGLVYLVDFLMPAPESEMKACAATPAADLEQQITDCRIPKNEREWWAHNEIARLKEAIAAAYTQGKAEGLEEAAKIVDGRIANWKVGTGTCRLSLLAECEDIATAIASSQLIALKNWRAAMAITNEHMEL